MYKLTVVLALKWLCNGMMVTKKIFFVLPTTFLNVMVVHT